MRDHRVRKSVGLLQRSVGGELSLDAVAREVGLSRPHFFKLFRENVGVTPNVYLNTVRTERAIERLIGTEQPVTSIALDLGFSSQASFTRFFSANVGIPPDRLPARRAHRLRACRRSRRASIVRLSGTPPALPGPTIEGLEKTWYA